MTQQALVLRNYLEQDASLRRLQAVAASMINPRHLVSVALSAISQNKALMTCSQESLFLALAKCAITGLEPDGQMAAIVPYGKVATFVPMYMGLIDLCHRSGKVVDIDVNPVFEGDDFAFQYGTKGFLHHVPCGGGEDPGKLTHVYTLVTYPNGIVKFKVTSRKQCEAARKRSPSGNSPKSAWVTDFVPMCCKTGIRRHYKTLPKSNEMRYATAFEQNDELQRPQRFDLAAGGIVVEEEIEPAKAETIAGKIKGGNEPPAEPAPIDPAPEGELPLDPAPKSAMPKEITALYRMDKAAQETVTAHGKRLAIGKYALIMSADDHDAAGKLLEKWAESDLSLDQWAPVMIDARWPVARSAFVAWYKAQK